MGHRLITALIWLNALGLVSCVVLIATALAKDDAGLAGQVASGVLQSLRLFVVGAALPAVAWGITAFEFDRRQTKKRMLESVVLYILLYQNSQTLTHAACRPTGTSIAKTYGSPTGYRRRAQTRTVPRMSQCLRNLVLVFGARQNPTVALLQSN